MTDTPASILSQSFAELLSEATDGGPGDFAWFTDAPKTGGLKATLASIDSEAAFAPCPLTSGRSPANLAAHLLYTVDLFERALRGDDAFEHADWPASWQLPSDISQDNNGWASLRDRLDTRLKDATQAVLDRGDWSDRFIRTGTMGNIAHLAYHLGQLKLIAANAANNT